MPKKSPGTAQPSGNRAYQVHRFTNSLSTTACISVTTRTKSGAVQMVAYSSFDPSAAGANYLADSGGSTALETMSLAVGAGASFDIAVVAVTPGEAARYTLDLAGCNAEASVTLSTIGSNPSVFGEPISLRAVVAGIGGRPTGTVVFKDGVTIGTGAIDSTGVAWLPVSSLDAGTHSLTAEYGGDLVYAPRVSQPVLQIVNPATTTTVVRSMSTPQRVGQPSSFWAAVTADPPSKATPTGTVDFVAHGYGSIGIVTLVGGRASVTADLGPDVDDLGATYAGNANFVTSGYVFRHAVSSEVFVTLTADAVATTSGAPVRFEAVVSPDAGPGIPTGTVTFSDGDWVDRAPVILGVVNVDQSPISLTTSSLAIGAHRINAEYSGDADHSAGWMYIAHFVDPARPNALLVSSRNPSSAGQLITLTATVSGAVGTPTGAVSLYDDSMMVGRVTLDSAGKGSFATSGFIAGAHPLTLVYEGDARYASSTSAALSQQVDPSATTIALASSQNPQKSGSAVTFIAAVASTAPRAAGPTGNVTFYDDTSGHTLLGTKALTRGQAALDVSNLTSGAHVISAVYGGDAYFLAASSSALTQSIAPSVTAVSVAATPTPSGLGESVQIEANVGAGGGGAATGTVTFRDGASALGTAPLDGSGRAVVTSSSLTVGTHALSAAYGGDGSHDAATAAIAHDVGQARTTTSLVSSVNPSRFGQPVTLATTVTSAAGIPQGPVLFKDGMATLGTVTLDASGVAHWDTSNLSAGDHAISVSYAGTDTLGPSSTAEPMQVVRKSDTKVTLTSSANPVGKFDTFTMTAKVEVVAPGTGLPTGEVALFDGTTLLSTLPLTDGTLPFAVGAQQLSAGVHDFTAEYTGDPNFSSAKSAVVQETVLKIGGVTVTVTAYERSYGLPTSFQTTVRGPNLSYPTGSVTYSDGGTVLGVAPLDSSGWSNWLYNALDAGPHTITVNYDGDGTYLPASTAVEVAIPQRGTTLTLSAEPSAPIAGEPIKLKAALVRSRTLGPEIAPQGPLPPVVGNVIFREGPAVLGTVPIPYGSATLTLSSLPPGSHDLSARYEGSNNYGASEGSLWLEVGTPEAGVDAGQPEAGVDAGPPEAGAPDAGQDGTTSDGAIADGGTAMPDGSAPADASSTDAPRRDGTMDASDALDAGDSVDARRDGSFSSDAAADRSPESPAGSGDTMGDGGGCGCSVAAPVSDAGAWGSVGFALGLCAIGRRTRRDRGPSGRRAAERREEAVDGSV